MSSLERLPPELVYEILAYLTTIFNRSPTPLHPLNALASATKQLHALVEEFARSQLNRHVHGFAPPKTQRGSSCRKKWLAETCQFCKRKSARRAVFYPSCTCCRLCDKQYFPKITMTQATKSHYLSKLDLFTPNPLHTLLPPLTTGVLAVMGSQATMILLSDVLARKTHIASLLGAKAEAEGYMSRRVAAHERIIAHMGIYFNYTKGEWRRAPELSDLAAERATKSMKSREGREEYVRKGLEREREAMGMGCGSGRLEGTGDEEDPLVLE